MKCLNCHREVGRLDDVWILHEPEDHEDAWDPCPATGKEHVVLSFTPSLPYPEPDGTFTAGWAGADASRDRAVREALDGTASKRQKAILRLLDDSKEEGATYREVCGFLGLHHGQSSGALSALHKAERVARLQERRHRCHVYVLPQYVGDRETRPQGRTSAGKAAYEEGWRDGHSHAEAQRKADVADLLTDAHLGGIKQGRRETAGLVVQQAQMMLGELGKVARVETHHHGCWTKHPACAIRALADGAARAGALDSGVPLPRRGK